MGIIDAANVTATCADCSSSETARVLDKGDRYSGSWWGVPSFQGFDIGVASKKAPHPDYSGSCKGCGGPAGIDVEFTGV